MYSTGRDAVLQLTAVSMATRAGASAWHRWSEFHADVRLAKAPRLDHMGNHMGNYSGNHVQVTATAADRAGSFFVSCKDVQYCSQ